MSSTYYFHDFLNAYLFLHLSLSLFMNLLLFRTHTHSPHTVSVALGVPRRTNHINQTFPTHALIHKKKHFTHIFNAPTWGVIRSQVWRYRGISVCTQRHLHQWNAALRWLLWLQRFFRRAKLFRLLCLLPQQQQQQPHPRQLVTVRLFVFAIICLVATF